MGNEAAAMGFIAASQQSGHLCSWDPIHHSHLTSSLPEHENWRTHLPERKMRSLPCVLLLAHLWRTTGTHHSLRSGVALKAEAMGLAVMLEMPLVICNIQRAGPSTGLPTKTEQTDLLQALYGRNGECPMPVIAARTRVMPSWQHLKPAASPFSI